MFEGHEMEIVNKDGRVFVFEGEEPYRRKDGSMTVLRLWSSSCVECGDQFVVKTPATVIAWDQSKSFATKRCEEHRLDREAVTAHWLKACADGKAKKASLKK
jgi:hypothetical protein